MKVIIKEWSNGTATVMTTNGHVVWTFSSVEKARQACREWQGISSFETIPYGNETAGKHEPYHCPA